MSEWNDARKLERFAGLPYSQQNMTPGVIPSVDQRRWQTCPVCFGKGIVASNFYAAPGYEGFSTNTAPEKCRSCDGRGIVR